MTLTAFNLTLTDSNDANQIIKYTIEKCHIKHLLLGIYSLCVYLWAMKFHSN